MNSQLLTVILVSVDIIVLPWCIWITLRSFKSEQKQMLADQEIAFLKTNLINDIQSIKDSLESTKTTTAEATKESKLALEKLNDKMDLFMSNELKLLKDMMKKS